MNFIGRNSSDDFGVVSYAWVFGDGTTSTEVDPVHIYTEDGQYTVTLTVQDAEGLTSTDTVTIMVDVDSEGGMRGIILENPTQGGIAKIRVINQPADVIVMYIYLHDSSGRFVRSFNAQEVFVTGGTYEIPVDVVRDGLYFVGLEMNQGDPLLLKLLVKN